jgi:hypothetical protein
LVFHQLLDFALLPVAPKQEIRVKNRQAVPNQTHAPEQGSGKGLPSPKLLASLEFSIQFTAINSALTKTYEQMHVERLDAFHATVSTHVIWVGVVAQ